MTDLKKHSQRTAAARAGFSERTARRFNLDPTPPSQRKIHHGRTVADPLEGFWENDGFVCIKVPNPPQDLAMFEVRLSVQTAAA